MRLTIIPVDGSVGKDGIFFNNLDLRSCDIPEDIHALQWNDVDGWIEYNSPLTQNQTITELPNWVNCCLVKWDEADQPPPYTPPTAEDNKSIAVNFLITSDWTTIPDVSDPTKSNPYLSNADEFIAWRNKIRQYAIYPVAGEIDWEAPPKEIWTKVE